MIVGTDSAKDLTLLVSFNEHGCKQEKQRMYPVKHGLDAAEEMSYELCR